MAGSYAAVSVQAAADCCEAVRALKDRVFLATGAPLLPLKDCSSPETCRCRYAKLPDRRSGDEDRRGFATGQRSVMYPGSENRGKTRGRRSDD